ncbi:SSI family serine proteinase inhibitor [Streptomonospora nanhaiensis]|uniref:Subtilisin inhibitor domain-containing protein n=1 Tax=Streptomonospora nanhaiensis TaxID=1323731 RepID=A0A853BQF3_9ACTN|nr:SSI family serine proteinase inhibitor [Streptomonospora nanhaiensis]MBV2365148.1 subtilase-type protease inhibitor [Streptomonospora nanhaiensis]MBX9387766.1 subtilase-type protease inhibitor [Streptomonospora nanhaiensis]NYI96642.1 hypothetical protein [Streptomonospora nanhaiensis]
MLSRLAASVAAAGSAAVLTMAAAAPADAQESSNLEITVERVLAGTFDRFWLNCAPDFGTHPEPGAACDRLRALDGGLDRLRPEYVPCPGDPDPVRVGITGTWRGEDRTFTAHYANSCSVRTVAAPVVPVDA